MPIVSTNPGAREVNREGAVSTYTCENVQVDTDLHDWVKAAVWAVRTTTTFEDALIKAVNLGGDSDTVGAITGQIAGRIYGSIGIPDRWRNALIAGDQIEDLAEALYVREFTSAMNRGIPDWPNE